MRAVWIFVSYVLLVALLSESEAAPRRAKNRLDLKIDAEPQEDDDHERRRRAVRESRGPTLNDSDQEEPAESEAHERKRRAAKHDDIKNWLEDPQRRGDPKKGKKGKKGKKKGKKPK